MLGDTSLPPGPTSGGSTATASVLPAIAAATDAAIDAVIQLAVKTDKSPFNGADPKSLKMTAGRVHKTDQSPENGTPFQDLLALRQIAALEGEGKSGRDQQAHDLSLHSFGTHFIEVTWDPGIARLRVSRVVSVLDAGRIINQKTARNQILGAVVMGIGLAMFEETVYDARNGKPVNNNFADYVVSTNADIPELDCIFLDHPDAAMGEYGARGIGEIGLTGVASALTMATYHATGIRVRELPVRLDKLMPSRVV